MVALAILRLLVVKQLVYNVFLCSIIFNKCMKIRVQRIHHFVNRIGIFDLGNVLWQSNDPFSVQNSGHLLQAQGVLLNSQGGIYGTDTVCSAQQGG